MDALSGQVNGAEFVNDAADVLAESRSGPVFVLCMGGVYAVSGWGRRPGTVPRSRTSRPA
jgi:hypothetical protein